VNPVELLGKTATEEAVREFLAAHAGPLSVQPVDPDLPERRYWVAPSAEVELLADAADRITTIFLYVAAEGHQPYRGPLPRGVQPHMTQEEVRGILGAPAFERPARELQYLGRSGPSDRYDYGDYSIHFQYSEAHGGFEVVALMTSAVVPERDDVH
jgi:hypothetical protein